MLYPTVTNPAGSRWQPYRYGNQYRGAWVFDGRGRGVVLIGATDGLMTAEEAQALDNASSDPSEHANGPNWYGKGPDCTPAKGWHAHPYEPVLYAIDPEDLGRVMQGTLQPWEVRPFDSFTPDWLLRLPTEVDPNCLGQWFMSMAWHPGTGKLYVVQGQCWERTNGEFRTGAAVHVLRLAQAGATAHVPPGSVWSL
jgi:hypothetical protein